MTTRRTLLSKIGGLLASLPVVGWLATREREVVEMHHDTIEIPVIRPEFLPRGIGAPVDVTCHTEYERLDGEDGAQALRVRHTITGIYPWRGAKL